MTPGGREFARYQSAKAAEVATRTMALKSRPSRA
jgi:hypothetical protein